MENLNDGLRTFQTPFTAEDPAQKSYKSLEVVPSSSSSANKSSPQVLTDEFIEKIDGFSFEAIVDHKISRFLDQLGSFYPEELYSLIMKKVEKPLLQQILRRTGGNQVHAARILGINRNTLRKKMKLYSLS